MKIFYLELYSMNIKVSSNSALASENLERDFALYLQTSKAADYLFKGVTINIFKEKAPYHKVPPVAASLYNLGSICYKKKNVHYIDYSGKGLMIYDFNKEEAHIYSEDEILLYEKARLTILSRIGELLDKRHIHRVHAVGFAKYHKATICLLPMAAGKTTMALNVLKKDKEIKLVSDDVCMIDLKSHIYPFILRVGARDLAILDRIPEKYITRIERGFYGQKYLIDLEYFKDRIAGKSKVCNILIGRRIFQDATEIKKLSKFKCFIPFIQSGVFGLGLPQIAELFLRGDFWDILSKINMIFSRTMLFFMLICRTNTYEIRIGRDIEEGSDKLIKFIAKN